MIYLDSAAVIKLIRQEDRASVVTAVRVQTDKEPLP